MNRTFSTVNKFFIPVVFLFSALNGCKKPDSPSLYHKEDPGPPIVTTDAAPILTESTDPKVNILFVIDNSGSMEAHQKYLSENIKIFAERLVQSERMDYRVGVVPIFDRKYLNDRRTDYGHGPRKMNPLGELRPLQGLPEGIDSSSVPPYITRDTPNPVEVIQKTLILGDQWGPEAEEVFSPVFAVVGIPVPGIEPYIPNFNLQNLARKNGFFYEKDAYLVVVLVTDAEDVSEINPSNFYDSLVEAKGGDESKVFIIAAVPFDWKLGRVLSDRLACKRTEGAGPLRTIRQGLANLSNNISILNICDSEFGDQMTDFADKLVKKTSAQEIILNFTPEVNSIRVFYGPPGIPVEKRQVVPEGRDGYWFDPQRNVIIISPNFRVVRRGVFSVSAKPIRFSNGRLGKIHMI